MRGYQTNVAGVDAQRISDDVSRRVDSVDEAEILRANENLAGPCTIFLHSIGDCCYSGKRGAQQCRLCRETARVDSPDAAASRDGDHVAAVDSGAIDVESSHQSGFTG